MVTCLACMVHKLVSLNNKTRYASAASCNVVTAAANILNSCPPCHRSCTNSLMRQSNGALLISSSVDRWYLLISHSATVPGLYLLGFGVSVLGSLPPLCLASALALAQPSCFIPRQCWCSRRTSSCSSLCSSHVNSFPPSIKQHVHSNSWKSH